MDNLPTTIEDFIEYVEGPSSPNKEYFTNSKDQIIEWAKGFGSVEDCGRCHSEPVVDLLSLQAGVMEHYGVPDDRCNEIADVLMLLSGKGISTDSGFCDHCNHIMGKDD